MMDLVKRKNHTSLPFMMGTGYEGGDTASLVVAIVLSIIAIGVVFALILLVLGISRHSRWNYEVVPTTDDHQNISNSNPRTSYSDIYKPVMDQRIQSDYENTFVGVSIPLLQDVSKV